jgi:hypothetical protein
MRRLLVLLLCAACGEPPDEALPDAGDSADGMFDPATSTRSTLFGGGLRWSDWTFGRGALRCDLLITSQSSPNTVIRPGDQTPAWP